MDTLAIYAAVLGGIVFILIMTQIVLRLGSCGGAIKTIIAKHLFYSYAIDRHSLMGPWTRASLFMHLAYISTNTFLAFFKFSSLDTAAKRAGTLSLINTVFLAASLSLSSVADILGISLNLCRRLHRVGGWVVLALISFHVAVMLSIHGTAEIGTNAKYLFATIGSGCLGALAVLSFQPVRKICYECFIRLHQALTVVGLYGIWRHIPETLIPRLYIYIITGVLASTSSYNLIAVLFKNGLLSGKGIPRAHITCMTDLNSQRNKRVEEFPPIRIYLHLPRPIVVAPGQYINLWLPSVNIMSWMQTHPFMVVSWARGEQKILEVAVKPCRGLTKTLAQRAQLMGPNGFQCMALFSGPHGITESVNRYESVLCVASGLGIAAVIPYVKNLLHGYNTVTSHVRRVHLVWQVQSLSFAISMQELLNDLLTDDVLDDGYILSISVFVEDGLLEGQKMPFGKHQRAFLYQGRPDYASIIPKEVSGEKIERLPNIRDERGQTLLIASAKMHQRDQLRGIVKQYLEQGLRMIELEYQP